MTNPAKAFQEALERQAAEAADQRWQYNFIGGQNQVTMMVSVTAAEADGWRADLGISEGGKVIDHGSIKSEWARTFEGAVSLAKSMAKKAKITWSPKHYSTAKDHKPGEPPPDGVKRQAFERIAKNLDPKVIKRLRRMTHENNASEAYVVGAEAIGAKHLAEKFKLIQQLVKLEGHKPSGLNDYQYSLYQEMMHQAKQTLDEADFQEFYQSF